MIKKGKFIVIDGVDGCGKSTICKKLYEKFKDKINTHLIDIYYDDFDNNIFNIIKNNDLSPEEEILLFYSIFQHNWNSYMNKWLFYDGLVIADRWITSTIAYQVHCLHSNIIPSIDVGNPDLYFLLKVDNKTANERIEGRKDKWESNNSIETNLSSAMEKIYTKNNAIVIDTNHKSIDMIVDKIYEYININLY